jgi:group I intron endonuclease
LSSIYSIYSAFNVVTKQRYIGFDSNWPNRQKSHKREHKKNNNIKFYNAIRKYGWHNFIWEIIYQSKDGNHCLNIMEPYFIKEYDTIKNGYNIVEGGNRGPILFGELNGMFGKTHNDEIKKKLSELATKRFQGKSYEQLYGVEKSNQLKQIRGKKAKDKNNSYKNNPRYDKKEYTFINILTGEKIICDRWTFYNTYNLNQGCVSQMINKGIIYKNWKTII